jgi:ABC-type sugar transport systems, permease components
MSRDGEKAKKRGFAIAGKLRKHGFAIAIIIPGTIFLVGFFVMILASTLQIAFTYDGIFPALGSFKQMTEMTDFWASLKRTILFVVVGTPLQLGAGLLLALLVWKPFRGRGIVRSAFILPVAITAVVTATILHTLTSDFGHINELLLGGYSWFPQLISTPIDFRGSEIAALGISLLGKTWRDMPISMLIILAGLEAIGEDQYEAAETLGAGSLQKFRYITLPLLIPAISTVLTLRSIECWKKFIFPFFLAPSFPLLSTLIDYAYHTLYSPGVACAIALVLVILIIATMGILNWVLKKLRIALIKI